MKIEYKGVELELEQLPNGKFKKPALGQFTKTGRGCTWLDDCRVPYESESIDTRRNASGGDNGLISSSTFKIRERHINEQSVQSGRFPANLIVSDDVLNDGKVSKSNPHPRTNSPDKASVYGDYKKHTDNGGWNDSGSFSRYFSLDKWWEERVKQLPESVQKTYPFLIVPKASKSEKNKGCEGLPLGSKHSTYGDYQGTPEHAPNIESKSKNNHPTVKPIRLFSYLITLGSREGDIVLDPFSGSGTTALAAKMLGRKAIAIELSEEYCKIASARCKGMSNG